MLILCVNLRPFTIPAKLKLNQRRLFFFSFPFCFCCCMHTKYFFAFLFRAIFCSSLIWTKDFPPKFEKYSCFPFPAPLCLWTSTPGYNLEFLPSGVIFNHLLRLSWCPFPVRLKNTSSDWLKNWVNLAPMK